MKTLVLLDTHALIHRAYHALPPFKSKKTGEPTGALYGLSTMLLKVVRELKPNYIVAAFDTKEPTFRHTVYEAYKAQRPEADDDLIKQIIRSHDVIGAFGIQAIFKGGFEADDILGTIVEQLNNQRNLKIIIVSGDMDVLQLVDDDRVLVYTLRKGIEDTILYNELKVVERYGFIPALLPDFKGLKGDPSDNIVGVPGIGEKTATDIIRNFGTLENVYKKLEKGSAEGVLKERTVQLLKTHKEDAFFSKTLATVRRDAPIKFDLPKSEFQINRDKLHVLFEELGFDSLISKIENGEKFSNRSPVMGKKKEYLILETEQELFLIPSQEAVEKKQKGEWKKIFEKKIVVSSNIKKIFKLLRERNIDQPEKFFDLTVAQWVSDSTKKSLEFFDARDFQKIYADTAGVLKKRGLEKVFYEIELPLIPVLAEMEINGIKIDRKFLADFKKAISGKLRLLEEKIYKLAGAKFNINSPAQVGEIVFEKFGATKTNFKKTKTGKISTKESELLKLKDKLPVVSHILEFRELAKLLATYVKPLFDLSLADGKVHTTYNQTGTVTGRLSSEAPNLQNIPVRSDFGAKIRNAFVSSPKFSFVSFDYSQIELRILADFSKDSEMIKAFQTRLDIHSFTASKINNIFVNEVTAKMRSRAKAINFGIVYGMGVRQLAQNTGMALEEARRFYYEYFRDFSGVKTYINKIKAEVKRNGFVETLYGRKRFFDLKSAAGSAFLEAEIERMAVNAIIQGTDADIVKLAAIKVHELFNKNDVRPILQVHDELLYEVRDDIIGYVVPAIKHVLEDIVALSVPLSVDIKVGKCLGSLIS